MIGVVAWEGRDVSWKTLVSIRYQAPTLVGVMVTLPGTRPPTEGGALLAVGDKVVLAKGVVKEEAAGLPRRFAEARCCCRRRWSGVITCD